MLGRCENYGVPISQSELLYGIKRRLAPKLVLWLSSGGPGLGRQRQIDRCEFEASLGNRTSSKTARAVTHRNYLGGKKKVVLCL